MYEGIPGEEWEITTWCYEMRAPELARPARTTDMRITPLTPPQPELLRWLWRSVGGPLRWVSRVHWTDDDWCDLATNPNDLWWVGSVNGETVGFFELCRDGDDVEIRCLGLLDGYCGHGYGGHLVTEAVTQAWQLGATRVWLDTCSKDGPAARPNYEARGFVQYEERHRTEFVPEPFSGGPRPPH